MKQRPVEVIVESGMAMALALVLSRLTILHLPNEGSISLEMLPILLLSARRGILIGSIAGGIFGGILKFMATGGRVLHPLQYVLDYPLAFGVLGMAGCSKFFPFNNIWVLSMTAFAMWLRFLCHWSAGIIFFAKYAPPGQSIWLYSLLYNGAYMFPSAILILALTPAIYKRLKILPR